MTQTLVRLVSPANIRTIDPEYEQIQRMREEQQKLEKELRKQGKLDVFETYYTSKSEVFDI